MNKEDSLNKLANARAESPTSEKVKIYLRVNKTKKGTDFLCDSEMVESSLVRMFETIIKSNNLIEDMSDI